jgi:hypothetical protein
MLPEPVSSAPVARALERDVVLAAGHEFAPEGGLVAVKLLARTLLAAPTSASSFSDAEAVTGQL